MNREQISIDRIKRRTIIALVSDDYLMETLVLKGDNAYDLSPRQVPQQAHKPKPVTFLFTMQKYFSIFEP